MGQRHWKKRKRRPFAKESLEDRAMLTVLIDQPFFDPGPRFADGVFSIHDQSLGDGEPADAIAFENFTLDAAFQLTEIEWIGAYEGPLPTSPSDTDFLVEIWPDAAGVPDLASGPLISTRFEGGPTAGIGGPDLSVTRHPDLSNQAPSIRGAGETFNYSGTISGTLDPGSYWISIVADQNFDSPAPIIDPEWLWHLGSRDDNIGFYAADRFFDPVGTPEFGVFDDENNLALTLRGENIGRVVDLELRKIGGRNNGNVVTWTITVSNNADNANTDATGVQVGDFLPIEVSLNGVTLSSGSFSAAGSVWSIPPIAPGEKETLTIVATVNDSIDPASIRNVAQVIAQDQLDFDSAPNNDDGDQSEDDEGAVDFGRNLVDLEVTKIADRASARPGEQVKFTVTITNNANVANVAATGVQVADALPPELTFVSATPSGNGTFDTNTGIWSLIAPLPVGEQESLEIVAIVNSGVPGNVAPKNVAQVVASDIVDFDSTPNNDGGEQLEDDEAAATITIDLSIDPIIDLELTKSANVTSVDRGGDITWTLTVINNSTNANAAATDVQVVEVLPSGVTLVNATPSGNGQFFNGLWSLIDPLAPGAMATLTLQTTVSTDLQVDTLVNTAQVVTAAGQPDVDSTPGNDDGDQSEDDEAIARVAVNPQIDLELTKTVDLEMASAGGTVTWTLVATNNDNQANAIATGVQIRDELPTGVTLLSSSATSGSYANDVWTLADPLPAGESATLTVTTSVDAGVQGGSQITNVAEVSAANELDVDSTPVNGDLSEDDLDSAGFVVELIDLELTKTVDLEMASAGDTVTWSVVVTNNSNQANASATGVQIRDELPPGVTFVSSFATNGSSANDIWTLANPIAPGESATLTVMAIVDSGVQGGSQITNVAEVSAANELDADSNPANGELSEDDLDSAGFVVELIDLELTKAVDRTMASSGDIVTWRVVVTNSSNQANASATGVQIRDALPPGVSLLSSSATNGSYGDDIWTLANPIAPGESATLTVMAIVDSGVQGGSQITNVAEVSAANELDVDSTPGNGVQGEDDQDSASIQINAIDLALTKEPSTTSASVGQLVSWILTLTNDASADIAATDITVSDELSNGVTISDSSTANGSYDVLTGLWTLAESLSPGDSATLTIEVTIDAIAAGATITNNAQVTSATGADVDSVPDNDDGDQSEDDEASATVTVDRSTLFGVKWNDENANGLFDSNESRLSGWTIYLDLNNDGIRQDAEPKSITDADGRYEFVGLDPGEYVIREEVQDGWEQTFPRRFAEIDSPKTTELADVVYPTKVAFANLDGNDSKDIVLLDANQVLDGEEITNRIVFVFDDNGNASREDIRISRTGGVQVLDLDGDDDDDVVVSDVNADSLLLYDYTGGQRQDRSIKLAKTGTVFVGGANLNSDNWTDLYGVDARNFTASVFVGSDGFQYQTVSHQVGANPAAAASGDFDGNGVRDLVVSNFGADTITLIKNPTSSQAATETHNVGDGPTELVVLDSRGENRDDLVILNHLDSSISVFLGGRGDTLITPDSSARLALPTGAKPKDILAADLNADGRTDLLVVNAETQNISRFMNDGQGGFVRVDHPLGFTPFSMDVRGSELLVAGLDLSLTISDTVPVRSKVQLYSTNSSPHTVTVVGGQQSQNDFGNVCFLNCSVDSGATLSSELPSGDLEQASVGESILVPAPTAFFPVATTFIGPLLPTHSFTQEQAETARLNNAAATLRPPPPRILAESLPITDQDDLVTAISTSEDAAFDEILQLIAEDIQLSTSDGAHKPIIQTAP